jgi:uncharacterized membrane protein YbhN (UPF0104 family)
VCLFSSRWVKIGVSVGLLAVLVWSTDVRSLAQHVLTARVEWILLAFLGYLAGQVLSAYKWQLLARPLGFQHPLHRFIVYYFAGMYLNLFSPSTVLGDMSRGVLLATPRGDLGPALQSVLADRVSGVVMLLWVCAAGVLLAGPTVLPIFVSYAMLLCPLLTGIVWWALPSLLAWPHVPFGQLRQWIARLVAPYWTDGPLVRRVCTLSVLFHLMQLGLQALLVHALGLVVPWWYLFLVVPVITLLSFLPVSVSGLGVREGGYVFFLVPLGIGTDEALAFSLLWTIIMMAAGLIGGIMLLLSPTARCRSII